MKTILITGSSGLIGSEAVTYFDARGYKVVGVDNNMRADFFGPAGDTTWNLDRLRKATRQFTHRDADVRDRRQMVDLVREVRPAAIIHCAAQPSHDLAAARPFDDFDVNANGTLNLLEATRQAAHDAPFVFMSTNKVYGDAPNRIPLRETDTRWVYAADEYQYGIPETFGIDQSLHSVFGASKVAGDVLTQEYGRYFNMPTVCLRGGCLTGPSHTGVELHGFLSYIVKTVVQGRPYTVFGYKGKQVRDQIHSVDVVGAMEQFINSPRAGEVYNLGGGPSNNASIIETLAMISEMSGKQALSTYSDQNRIGDHICYISDIRKFKTHYPKWNITRSLEDIIGELVEVAQRAQIQTVPAANNM